MMERIDYWRGFTGGFLAGVAVGAWIYLSPGKNRKPADLEGLDQGEVDEIFCGASQPRVPAIHPGSSRRMPEPRGSIFNGPVKILRPKR